MSLIKGIITPMVTPVKNGSLDEEGLKELLRFLKDIGVSGAFPMGSTGLFPLFSFQDHRRFLELSIKHKPPNMAAYAGVSRNNFDETMEMLKAAKDLGYDAAVVVVPYYLKLSQESIYAYYDKISKLGFPIIVYNIPQFTGNSILPETLRRLAEENSNVLGIKDSSGDLRLLQQFINELPKGFLVYQGQDDLLLASLTVGASGGVCGTSNFSEKIVDVYKKRSLEAQAEVAKIMKLFSSFEFPKPYYYLFRKLVLKESRPRGYMPFPMSDLTENEEKAVEEALMG